MSSGKAYCPPIPEHTQRIRRMHAHSRVRAEEVAVVFVPFPYCGERLGHRLVENVSHCLMRSVSSAFPLDDRHTPASRPINTHLFLVPSARNKILPGPLKQLSGKGELACGFEVGHPFLEQGVIAICQLK